MDAVSVKLRSPRILVTATAIILSALALVAAWRYFHPAATVNEPYLASLIQIKALLRQPQSAVYSQYGRDPLATVQLRHDGDYETTGWVQADDQSGQLVRRNWMCVVRPQGGGHFLPVYVELGKLRVGSYTPDTP